MEPSIIVAIIALIGALINTILIKTSNRKINIATVRKTEAETQILYNEFKNKIIEELQIQIDSLKEEIEILKKREQIEHNEKLKLEIKLEHLIEENEVLRKQIISNKNEYEKEINHLRDQIKSLKRDLTKHKKDTL